MEEEEEEALPPQLGGTRVEYGTLGEAVERSGAAVAAAVASGNVQLAQAAEHLDLSLVRRQASSIASCA